MKKLFFFGHFMLLAISIIFVTSCSSSTSSPVPTTGVAQLLIFTTQPNGAAAGLPLATQPVVSVEDLSGKVVSSYNATVTIRITAGTGVAGSVLSGTTVVTAVNGVAKFTDLSINQPGLGYTLTAIGDNLPAGTSQGFAVTGATPVSPTSSASPTPTPTPSSTTSPSASTSVTPSPSSSVSTTPSASISPTSTAAGGVINLVAPNISFNMSSITVKAGSQVTVNFNNMDGGIPHTFSVYTDSSAATSIFKG